MILFLLKGMTPANLFACNGIWKNNILNTPIIFPQHYIKCLYCFLLICISACQPLPHENKQRIQAAQLVMEDHVLNDRIYDVANKQYIDKAQLLSNILSSQYILLGETHDNIRHHLNQAWVIDNLAKQSHSTSVSFEMIDNTQAKVIADVNIKTADKLVDLLNQHKSGWEYETYYKGLFESVLQAGFRIYPANIERQKLIDIIRQNKTELPNEIEQLIAEVSLTHDMESSLQNEIIESHCGMIDQETAQPMMQGQRIRDVTMALSLLNSDSEKRVIIAGSGHVRKDRGVPLYLASQDKAGRSIAVSMLEVEQDHIDIASYQTFWDANELPFDYVWFTARASREDPCFGFKMTTQ
jgi:uncharacterized iron-regulated protein